MKICVVSGIFHPEIGGPATHLYNLCAELAERGNEIYVVTYGDTKEKFDYPFFIKRIPRKSRFFLRFLRFTYQVIKTGKHCNVFYVDHYGLPVALANIFLHKPIVIRVASDFIWEFATRHKFTSDTILNFQKKKHSLKIRIIKSVQSFYIKRADFIIVPSNYIKDMVIGWNVAKEKIRIFHNAIGREFEVTASKETAKKILNLEGKIITTIGRLIPLKGIDKLIEITKELNDTKLLIIGDGPEKENLRQLVKSINIEDRVIFKGEIPRNKMPLYLKASDIFILNSEAEGSPQVILEAMSVGVPIIATKVGGIPEIIENEKDSLLIEPDNLLQLKTTILRLLENQQLRISIIESAKEKVKSFSFDRMVNEILELLQYLVVKRKQKIILQEQLVWLRRGLAFFVFYSGILWLIQNIIDLMFKKEMIVILTYHRVNDKSDFITQGMDGRDVSVKNFERHIRYLKKNYQIISLDDFIRYVKEENGLPKKSAIITFDDGYQDNYTNAFPILRRYNVPATIFLIADFITAKKLMWLHRFYYHLELLSPDEEAHIASEIYLSGDQIREMNRAGISIGSHTLTHRVLPQLNEDEVKNEILGSKRKIEEILEKPILHFAYPFGDNSSFTPTIKELVRTSGFLSSCSRFEGINTAASDIYTLKRIGIGDCKLPIFASKLVLNEILAIFKKT